MYLEKLLDIQIQITMDGNKEIHDKRRIRADGKSSFDKICEGIEELINIKVLLVPVLKLDGYWFLSDCLRLSNISVKPFESIKVLILKSINKTNIYEKCTNSEKVKGIYSLVYVISTAVIMAYGVIFSISLFSNYSSVISRFEYFL